MNKSTFFLYLLVMAGTTYLIRTIPFLLVKGKIKSRFWKSFLYYIPYAVLAAMTLPGVMFATGSWITALAGVLIAIIISFKKDNLLLVAVVACAVVYVTGLIPGVMGK